MKKKLILALLTALLLLLASSYALAENYPSHSCDCGENTWSTWRYSSEAQHYSFCIGCGAPEYGDHYGGMATCIAQAICEGCGSAYGELDPNNHNWGDWVWLNGSTHVRECRDCPASEEGTHTGGTATCQTMASCEGCGASYGEPDPSKHTNMSDWNYASETQHFRYCLDCVDPVSYEYEGHTGGDSSCVPVCEECHQRYIAPNGKHSNMCDWFYNDAEQHRRYCLDCGTYESNEYEDHYGGTATCTKRAVCEGCGTEYGERSDVHPWGEWEYLDGTNHERRCTNPDCHASDYANHSGGDGSCWTECEDCGEHYNNAEGQHRTMSVWYYLDGAQHMRHCVDCGYGQEYEDHTGGTATCQTLASCEVCGESYGEYDSDTHVWEQWMPDAGNPYIHTRTCQYNASHTESESHYGGDSSCRPLCEGCGAQYPNEKGEHRNMSDWNPFTAVQHARYCLDCKDITSYEYADHTGGDDTCQPICKDCGAQYTNKSGKHLYMSTWVAISATQHSRYCLDCSTYEYADHTGSDGSCRPTCEVCGSRYPDLNGQHLHMSVWEGVSDTQHTRICTDCYRVESIEYGNHSGGTATCSTQAVCQGCSMSYGSLDNTRHGEYSGWTYHNETQHSRYCQDCSDPSSIVYEDHYGGTATCTSPAICEGCSDPYGKVDPGNHIGTTDWVPYSYEQHYRACMGCASPDSYEFENHSGGTATCTEDGVCEVCKAAYIPALQHSWGEWKPNGNGTHTRVCANDADHTETEDCSGGDGSCRPICEGCGTQYKDANGEHRNMSEWFPYSGTQHFRYCKDCDQYEYANHHGDGSCTPVCADCSLLYSDENGEHRNVTDWIFINNDRHFRYCPDCGSSSSYEYADHSGGKANCTEKAVCEGCGKGYGELAPDDHDWGEWKSNGDGTHTRICKNDVTHTETEDCTGGTATCTEDGVCEVCEATYIPAINHSWGEWKPNGNGTHTRVCANDATHTETEDCTGGKASCTEDGVCEVCEAAYIPAINHSWGEWKPNGNGTHTRVCAHDADHTESEDCSGGTATCTDKAICEVCGSEHGAALGHIPGAEADCTNDQFCTREGCGELLTEKLGHDYTAVVTKPTCTENGYTTYTCSRCEESYQADQTAARGHRYDLWYPNQDGTHSAKCKHYACRHEGTTECTLYEITVKHGEDEVILTICPVCGDHETATFSVMSGATIKNVFINQPLPHGEQIVRELDAPFDGVLYAFTAAYESAGRVVPFNGKVSVSLPLDAEKYAEFRLVRVDVTPATETTERTEGWTDVAFTFENGRLTFETDVAGLFLLVPME